MHFVAISWDANSVPLAGQRAAVVSAIVERVIEPESSGLVCIEEDVLVKLLGDGKTFDRRWTVRLGRCLPRAGVP